MYKVLPEHLQHNRISWTWVLQLHAPFSHPCTRAGLIKTKPKTNILYKQVLTILTTSIELLETTNWLGQFHCGAALTPQQVSNSRSRFPAPREHLFLTIGIYGPFLTHHRTALRDNGESRLLLSANHRHFNQHWRSPTTHIRALEYTQYHDLNKKQIIRNRISEA